MHTRVAASGRNADFDLDVSNDSPSAITYANNRFYVVDGHLGVVYAYTSSGQRVESADFYLDPDNISPSDITYANNRFYVVDWGNGKVYVYTGSGQ